MPESSGKTTDSSHRSWTILPARLRVRRDRSKIECGSVLAPVFLKLVAFVHLEGPHAASSLPSHSFSLARADNTPPHLRIDLAVDKGANPISIARGPGGGHDENLLALILECAL